MKRILLISILTLLVTGSMLAGTLAYYSTGIDELAAGSFVAKEFIFLGEGTDSFEEGAKIAPSETVTWPFSVKNYDGNIVTETDLYYRLTLHVTATEGKSAIAPLEVSITDAQGNVINTVVGTGTFDLYGGFPLAEAGQDRGYAVVIHWPEGGENDSDYAGENFGNTIRVSALARQLPFDIPDPEPQSDIHVLYEIINTWNEGGVDRFSYKITISNNSDQDMDGWCIQFSLPTDRITAFWNAKESNGDLPGGNYSFCNPANYNKTIAPGGSISFGGNADGSGREPIENVLVNGKNVDLECILAPGGTDPEEPDPPEGAIHVLYETGKPWGNNNFNYRVTITNNSTGYTVYDWNITFAFLSDRIEYHWPVDYRAEYNTPSDGSYKFYHPTTYYINIPPGGSVQFGGKATGTGEDPMKDVFVNGYEVVPECELGKQKLE